MKEFAARASVREYLAAAERHVEACEPLRRGLDTHLSDVAGWPAWRKEARRLAKAGRTILADEDTYGAYLDAVAAGKPRARLTIDQLRSRIAEGRVKAAEMEKPEPRREPAPEREEGIARILDDPEKLRELREKYKKRQRKLDRHMRRRRGLSM